MNNMAIFCIPQHLVEKLKASALKGQVDIQKLYDMSSQERRDFFSKFTDKELGKFINTEFEKAIVSKQKTALTDWANGVFNPKMKEKPIFKNVMDKINSLDEMGILNPKSEKQFLQDLAADKLGINVSPEEVRVISQKAAAINKAQESLGSDLGNPNKVKENISFFLAKKEMDDYLQSITPANKFKVLTGTVGRGVMLTSVKSPLLNVASNIEVGFTEALARRISRLEFRGADNKLAVEYVKMANKIYQKTGYDISRMTTLSDAGASGQRVLGETVHSGGKGIIRRVGRFFEDTTFKQLMGAPDVAFSSAHFADSVNLNAKKLAKQKGLNANEIMNDAMRLNPQTAAGEILRAQGILDAQKATWTNSTWASKISEGIRKVLNGVSGNARAGDYLLPFVKAPANVIATGMDYAGMGIPKALFKTVKAIRTGGVSEIATKEFTQSVVPDLVRAGLGITTAFIIAHNLKPNDFVGAYDPSRSQIEQLRNSNTNSIRIGNKWISMDYFGPIAVPLTAMMYAKKYGSTAAEKTFQYSKGTLEQVFNLPGISDAYDYFRQKANQPKNQTLAEATQATSDYILNQAMSRLIPSFSSDVANSLDPLQRQAKGTSQVLMSKIPGLRTQLPAKTDVFGNQIKGESPLSEILFGSRVKTNRENNIVSEVDNVASTEGKSVNFIDWDKSSNAELAQFKQQMGESKYQEAKVKYGEELQKLLNTLISSKEYKDASNYDKLSKINNVDTKAIKNIFSKYGFTYKKGNSSMDELLAAYDKGQYENTNKFNIFQLVGKYLEASYQDPAGAWKALTTPERLKDVLKGKGFNNGIVQFERKKGLSKLDASNKATQVDHIIADVLGGTNELKNLQVLNTSDNSVKGQLEKYLAEQVRQGNLTRKQAQEIDKNWKTNLKLIGK